MKTKNSDITSSITPHYLRMSDVWLKAQQRAFQTALNDGTLAEALAPLVEAVYSESDQKIRSAIYILPKDREGLHLIVGMSEAYAHDVNGFKVAPESPACGLAMHTGEAVITEDVEEDPRWQPFIHMPRNHHFRACWSFPIRTDKGPALGTLAFYLEQPGSPTVDELQIIDILTHTAAIIISRQIEIENRAIAESEVRERELKYQTLFTSMTEGFCTLQLLFVDDHQVSDYKFLDANPAFQDQTGLNDFIGKSVQEVLPDRDTSWLKIFHNVLRKQKPVHFVLENAFVHQGVWHEVYAFPHGAPEHQQVGMLLIDISQRISHQNNLRESEQHLRTFIEASSDMVYRISADWQELHSLRGKIFLKEPTDSAENWLDSYIPVEERARVWKEIHYAIRHKATFESENKVLMADGSIGWIHTRAIPLFDKKGQIIEWLGAASDITLRKTHEEALQHFNEHLEERVKRRTAELKESRDQLRSIFDTSLVQMSILKAHRDEHGKIQDFVILITNKELDRTTGRDDLVGKYYAEQFPGIREVGLFDLIVKALETGIPQQTEYFYPHEGFDRWFSCMFVKFDDGVVATNVDITSRKNAEAERLKNYVLLKQSEEIALLGSWEFDIKTQKLICSDGMYGLFELPKETLIEPGIYLKYAAKESVFAAQKVVGHIESGRTDFEETLDILLGERRKVVRVKGKVIHDEAGNPTRVLGVDKDITALRTAEQKIRSMEAEQQLEVFRVSLSTLEEERNRISQSLHNGIGQILYSTKICLASLAQDLEADVFDKHLQYSNKLLTAAIDETRRVSHELMPTTLQEYGLKIAIDAMCEQMSGGTHFLCKVVGTHTKLEKYLELAVYRIVQELMNNIYKHAEATEATVRIHVHKKGIKLRVEDNGKGMSRTTPSKPGIGLASIRSKIQLLNGDVDIDSTQGKGTIIDITIPIPQ